MTRSACFAPGVRTSLGVMPTAGQSVSRGRALELGHTGRMWNTYLVICSVRATPSAAHSITRWFCQPLTALRLMSLQRAVLVDWTAPCELHPRDMYFVRSNEPSRLVLGPRSFDHEPRDVRRWLRRANGPELTAIRAQAVEGHF